MQSSHTWDYIDTPAGKAQFTKMPNPGYLVPGCSVILGNFRFDNDPGIEFSGNDKIRRQIKAFDPFGPFGFSKLMPDFVNTSSMADSRLSQCGSSAGSSLLGEPDQR